MKRVLLITACAVAAVTAAACTSSAGSSGGGSGHSSSTSTGGDDAKFVASQRKNIELVAAQANFMVGDIKATAKHATSSNLARLANQAKTLQTNLGTLRSNTETAPGGTGTDALDVEVAIDDLKKAAGEVLTVAGTTNATTVANASVDLAKAVHEWNPAVKKLWLGAEQPTKVPTIKLR